MRSTSELEQLRFEFSEMKPILLASKEVRDKKPDLPSVLDPKRVGRDVFERDSMANDQGLGSFSEEALEALVKNKVALDEPRRRALLGRLKWPDVPGLVELIAADLKSKESRGFGEFPIHRALLARATRCARKAGPDAVGLQAVRFRKDAQARSLGGCGRGVRRRRARGVAGAPVGVCENAASGVQHGKVACALHAAGS